MRSKLGYNLAKNRRNMYLNNKTVFCFNSLFRSKFEDVFHTRRQPVSLNHLRTETEFFTNVLLLTRVRIKQLSA